MILENSYDFILEHEEYVRSAEFSHDDTMILCASNDDKITVWNAETGKIITKIEAEHISGDEFHFHDAKFSHDDTKIASASNDERISIWDVKSGELVRSFPVTTYGANSVAFSHNDTMIVSTEENDGLRVFNVATGTLIFFLEGSFGFASFNHDSSQILCTNDGEIKIFDVQTQECIKHIQRTSRHYSNQIFSLKFNHNSTSIVSAEGKNVKIWDPQTGRLLKELKGHIENVYSATFNHEGTMVVSGGEDNFICIWDVESGNLLLRLEDNEEYVLSVSFNHSGTMVVSGGDDDVFVYNIKLLLNPFISTDFQSLQDNLEEEGYQLTFVQETYPLLFEVEKEEHPLMIQISVEKDGSYKVRRIGGVGDHKLERMIAAHVFRRCNANEYKNIETLIRAIYDSFRYSEAADLYSDPAWNIRLKF